MTQLVIVTFLLVLVFLLAFALDSSLRKCASTLRELGDLCQECTFWMQTVRKYRDLAIEAAGGEPSEAILALDKTTVEYMDEGNRSSGA